MTNMQDYMTRVMDGLLAAIAAPKMRYFVLSPLGTVREVSKNNFESHQRIMMLAGQNMECTSTYVALTDAALRAMGMEVESC